MEVPMPNDRLREALTKAGLTYADAATVIGVDPKTRRAMGDEREPGAVSETPQRPGLGRP